MKHYGDVSKISGSQIEPVDIITFGSPCQDMSVAGKREGMKHSEQGDEETTTARTQSDKIPQNSAVSGVGNTNTLPTPTSPKNPF